MLRSRVVSSTSCIICRDTPTRFTLRFILYTLKPLQKLASFRTFSYGARVFSSAGHNIRTFSISIWLIFLKKHFGFEGFVLVISWLLYRSVSSSRHVVLRLLCTYLLSADAASKTSFVFIIIKPQHNPTTILNFSARDYRQFLQPAKWQEFGKSKVLLRTVKDEQYMNFVHHLLQLLILLIITCTGTELFYKFIYPFIIILS